MPRLVLASGSRWRRQLLDRLALPYAWESPDIDETPRPGKRPSPWSTACHWPRRSGWRRPTPTT